MVVESKVESMDQSSENYQRAMQQRLKKLMRLAHNQNCVDCSTPRPRWATLIVPPKSDEKSQPLPLGCFCCLECSGAHRRLGTHVTFVRSIDLDTWKEREVQALEFAGNQVVNTIFEARMDEFRKVDSETDQDERLSFIRDKYEQKFFFDHFKYLQYMKNLPPHLQPPPSFLVTENLFQETQHEQQFDTTTATTNTIYQTKDRRKSSDNSPPPKLVSSNSIESHGDSSQSSQNNNNKAQSTPGHLQEYENYASSDVPPELMRTSASGTILKTSIKMATNLFTFKKRSGRSIDRLSEKPEGKNKSPRSVPGSPRKIIKRSNNADVYDEVASLGSASSEYLHFSKPPHVHRKKGLNVLYNKMKGAPSSTSSLYLLSSNAEPISLEQQQEDSRNTTNYKWHDDIGFEVVHCDDTRDTYIEHDIMRQNTWPRSVEIIKTDANFPNFEDMFNQNMLNRSVDSSTSNIDDMDLPLDTHSPLVTMKKNGDIEMIHCKEKPPAQIHQPNNLKNNENEVFRKVDFHFDMLAFTEDDRNKSKSQNTLDDDLSAISAASSIRGRIGGKYKLSVKKGKRLFRRKNSAKRSESLGDQIENNPGVHNEPDSDVYFNDI